MLSTAKMERVRSRALTRRGLVFAALFAPLVAVMARSIAATQSSNPILEIVIQFGSPFALAATVAAISPGPVPRKALPYLLSVDDHDP